MRATKRKEREVEMSSTLVMASKSSLPSRRMIKLEAMILTTLISEMEIKARPKRRMILNSILLVAQIMLLKQKKNQLNQMI